MYNDKVNKFYNNNNNNYIANNYNRNKNNNDNNNNNTFKELSKNVQHINKRVTVLSLAVCFKRDSTTKDFFLFDGKARLKSVDITKKFYY